jgi:nitroreductase
MNPTLELLLNRRSVKATEMREPGPDADALRRIIEAGIRVPDHGKLGPWRFVRFTGAARARFGEVLVEAWQQARPEDPPGVVAVISSVTPDHKIPEWEQILSAGAVCQNMLVAASALGFCGQWLTEWYGYDPHVTEALGLGEAERIAGWIYLGSSDAVPKERARPGHDDRVKDWQPPR